MRSIILLFGMFVFSNSFAGTFCGMVGSRADDSHTILLKYAKDVDAYMSVLKPELIYGKEFSYISISDNQYYEMIKATLGRINPYAVESRFWKKGYDGVDVLSCIEGEVAGMSKEYDIITLKAVTPLLIRNLRKINVD